MSSAALVIRRALRRRARSSTLLALLLALAGSLGVAAAPGTASAAVPGAASATVVPARAVVPASCRAAVTIVRPDTTLAVGVLQGGSAKLYTTGRKLGYTPTALAYLGSSTNKGVTIDRFFAIDPQGRLHRLTVTERRSGASTSVSATDAVIARGWSVIRGMVSSGPYLYGLTTDGGLKRYAVTTAYGVRSAGTIATRGWGSIRSLAYGGWWKLGSGQAAEDIVGLRTDGTISAYVIPRWAPARVSSRRLASGTGWDAFAHLAVGECTASASRPVLGIKPNGDVHAYLDVNGNDQSWRDLRTGARVATGWTGVVAD